MSVSPQNFKRWSATPIETTCQWSPHKSPNGKKTERHTLQHSASRFLPGLDLEFSHARNSQRRISQWVSFLGMQCQLPLLSKLLSEAPSEPSSSMPGISRENSPDKRELTLRAPPRTDSEADKTYLSHARQVVQKTERPFTLIFVFNASSFKAKRLFI